VLHGPVPSCRRYIQDAPSDYNYDSYVEALKVRAPLAKDSYPGQRASTSGPG